jgi:hypothetical protein
MRFTSYSFGSVRVDGVAYDHDLIIDRGKVRKRKKAASRKFRGAYGHTPLSAAEDIPWRCRRLVIGTGADGALPVMQEVRDEARRREIDLVVLPTAKAINKLAKAPEDTNAILHLTCLTGQRYSQRFTSRPRRGNTTDVLPPCRIAGSGSGEPGCSWTVPARISSVTAVRSHAVTSGLCTAVAIGAIALAWGRAEC